jgi:hypothetical protein
VPAPDAAVAGFLASAVALPLFPPLMQQLPGQHASPTRARAGVFLQGWIRSRVKGHVS